MSAIVNNYEFLFCFNLKKNKFIPALCLYKKRVTDLSKLEFQSVVNYLNSKKNFRTRTQSQFFGKKL